MPNLTIVLNDEKTASQIWLGSDVKRRSLLFCRASLRGVIERVKTFVHVHFADDRVVLFERTITRVPICVRISSRLLAEMMLSPKSGQ